jgi:hypothetical protein
MRSRVRWVAVVLLASLAGVSACVSARSTGSPAPSSPASAFDARVSKIIGWWAATGSAKKWDTAFVPLQALTVLPPETESTGVEIDVVNLHAVKMPARIPTGFPSSGRISFPDGSELTVPLATARQTIDDFMNHIGRVTAPACTRAVVTWKGNGCSLTVTGISAGLTTLLTSRGEARVPPLLFAVKQLRSPIARVSVRSDVPVKFGTVTMPGADAESLANVNRTFELTSVNGAKVNYGLLTGDCEDDIANGRAISIRGHDHFRTMLDGLSNRSRNLHAFSDPAAM